MIHSQHDLVGDRRVAYGSVVCANSRRETSISEIDEAVLTERLQEAYAEKVL